jgi:GNAT superfamily N-acetyltransferase
LEIQIRLALAEDTSAIASVLSESFAEYETFYTPQGFTATTPTSEGVLSRINEGPVWIALCDQIIGGTVGAVPVDEDLYIRGMAIVPSARGRGIGEMLLRQVESFAAAHGYKRLLLSTTPFLTRAIRLYEHFGFRRSSDEPNDLFGTPLFTMIKPLNDLEVRRFESRFIEEHKRAALQLGKERKPL